MNVRAALAAWVVSLSFGAGLTLADVRPHAGMLRYPDVGKNEIVFLYANDLWTVPRAGGVASLLASPPGAETFPRFSPDGQSIAFVGNYDGNRDIYTIPLSGGIPTRLTHHPAGEFLCDWTPDGRVMFASNGMAGLQRQQQLFTVAADGGLPVQLPVPYGAVAAISPDGQWLAYTPHTADGRTWKRYRGGMATDIWLFNLKTHESKKITDWEGTDSQPMWHGKLVYYMSDAGPEHRLNIWKVDPTTLQREQITKFADNDIKYPAVGPGATGQGEIVFQCGAQLYLLDLGTNQSRVVEVYIPGDRAQVRPKIVDAARQLMGWEISPTGKRAALEARGDIWTAPARDGTARNLTRTDDVAERDPSWSPDGRWIAYFSDASGEYELYVTQSDGLGETRRLTNDGKCFRYGPTWSPDSKHIAFSDKTGAMFLHTIEGNQTRPIDVNQQAQPTRFNWAPDSRWITYTKVGDNFQSAIWVYNVETGQKSQLTAGVFNDSLPTFDRKGELLYFVSNREITEPIYEDLGSTFAYANTGRLYFATLRKDVKSPLAPKSDEEKWGDEKKEEEKKAEEKKKESKPDSQPSSTSSPTSAQSSTSSPTSNKGDDESDKSESKDIKPITIDLEGFERRVVALPVDRGAFSALGVNGKHQLLYVRRPRVGAEGRASVKIFDLNAEKDEDRVEKNSVEADYFVLSADGKKMLVLKDNTGAIVDAAADQKMDKPISTADLKIAVDPRKEWKQMFVDAWRIQRDYFYDPHMHGLNWKAVRDHYEKMLADCASREDLSYVISEMISELNVGHAYYWGGDVEPQPNTAVGLLGCDFEPANGAYRISKIYEGGIWDADARGPLSQPGVDVKVGDYLLAVNGAPLDPKLDPWAAFVGLADRVVTLTVSDKPQRDESAREVVVKTLGSEADLRYRAWIERNRATVASKSDGKVGYIYVPDTGVNGQNNLFRQFYGQIDKQALIIDERWNGGGQIPTRFIELLNRPRTNYWAVRDGKDWGWPTDSHQGPKCMLINGLAGSGGDCFPYYFKKSKIGKVIGTRTWGGLVGISGNPSLIDGGYTSAPTFAFYELDGTWGVEGHGVDPDIEVVDDPAKMQNGGDPQLDAAISLMLDEIRQHPYTAPARPKYPDRTGMGILEADK